ncbi:pyruvate kinase [Candidatus Saccharibacteria bacterium]|nr:MAG: pyruvate kinase [Candidatus Saccharibacteria bacterium]
MIPQTHEHFVPLKRYKRTKIIATVGPATDSYAAIKRLIEDGANGLRLNFSHGDHPQKTQHIAWIRKASRELKKPVAIIQDLQGPKIRLGEFDDIITVQKGQTLKLGYDANWLETGIIPTQYDLSSKVKRGERLYIFDGKIRTKITTVREGIVYCEAENDGILIKRKGINLPDTDFGGDVITEKDRADLAYGSTQDIDYVAMSFIQSAADIESMRGILKNLGYDVKIIAKLETKLAIDNIEEIMQVTDAAMVARGDMAVEVNPEVVPVAQRQIISFGLQYGKPTIVATQMLGSMTESPEPSRAEVSDVATAVYLGADCVMLSDETAMGKYPHEAVKIMKRIINYSQQHGVVRVTFRSQAEKHPSRQLAISRGVIKMAESIHANAIVAETKTGATVLNIASERPDVPIIAVTDSHRTAQQLAIVYDVKSYVRPVSARAAQKITDFMQREHVFSKGDIIVMVSGKQPGVVGTTDTIKIRQLD